MSVRKILLATSVVSLALALSACAPKSGSDEGASTEPGGDGSTVSRIEVDEDKVADAEKEAKKLNDENHEMRRDIFKLKTQLGIPTDASN